MAKKKAETSADSKKKAPAPVEKSATVSAQPEEQSFPIVGVGASAGGLAALADEPFDMVFMDVRMPGMDGEEATRKIRNGEIAGVDPHVPIIALTAHALKGDRKRFLAAGMDDYIAKPFDLDELDSVLDRIAGKRADGAATPG